MTSHFTFYELEEIIIITILNSLLISRAVYYYNLVKYGTFQIKIWNYYDVNYFRAEVCSFLTDDFLLLALIWGNAKTASMLNWLGGVVSCHEIIGQSLAPVSLGRASSMKLGGEILVPCFWSVPEQRINFLATMSSAKMNTKLLRKPAWRKSLQRCLIRYWVLSLIFNIVWNLILSQNF